MTTRPDNSKNSLAVLFDADNANPAIIEELLAEIAKLGIASVKRIYGDWTSNQLSSWKDALLEFSIQPIQQFSYTTGKNATDSAMIIDAMDLLHTEHFQGFCLVSSDSDFTRLAVRIRESGLRAYGFGERKTPRAFVSACDRFICTEDFGKRVDTEESTVPKPPTANELRHDTALIKMIRDAIEANRESEWAQLSRVGSYMNKTANEFDSRNYGFSKLSGLISAIGLFEVERKDNQVYVRDRRGRG